jgi:hypothetical protein
MSKHQNYQITLPTVLIYPMKNNSTSTIYTIKIIKFVAWFNREIHLIQIYSHILRFLPIINEMLVFTPQILINKGQKAKILESHTKKTK